MSYNSYFGSKLAWTSNEHRFSPKEMPTRLVESRTTYYEAEYIIDFSRFPNHTSTAAELPPSVFSSFVVAMVRFAFFLADGFAAAAAAGGDAADKK
jgi:hypothetical protein